MAIAILKMHETEICACESVSDLFTLMSTMTSRLWAADKLIAVSLLARYLVGRPPELTMSCRLSTHINRSSSMGIYVRGASAT